MNSFLIKNYLKFFTVELLNWIEALTTHGVALIKNAPESELEARKIINRVGFIKKTNYGEEFILKTRSDATNYSYVGAALQMHTDLPFYEYKPGTNLLHCLVQSTSGGGQNTITDGFYVANFMKEHFPEYFTVLTKTLVNWRDSGVEGGSSYDKIYRAPVIWYSTN